MSGASGTTAQSLQIFIPRGIETYNMKQIFFFLLFICASFFCGCDKQTKINGDKIEVLSQKIILLEQNQSKQMAALQSQMTSLAPMLDKINGSYFEKSHDDAFFFHTNTLFLLLTVDRKIEAQLKVADSEREAEHTLAYYYHTNQTDTLYFCVAQIENAMEGQEIRMVDKINAETRRVSAASNDELLKQIKLLSVDQSEIARRNELAAEVAQIKSDLEAIKTQLGITNPPAVRP
jgi:hypothetical protein